MKKMILASLLIAAIPVHAQMTAGAAFIEGQNFANSAKGKSAANNQINATTGTNSLPNFTTNAPESGYYAGGKGLVGAAGTGKIVDCETYTAPTAFQQTECDAVNFVSKNPTTRYKYNIDKTTDPVLTASKPVINNPGDIPATSTQSCQVVTTTTPGTSIKETCVESKFLETIKCRRGFTADIGNVIEAQHFSTNMGSEVPQMTAKTFDLDFDITGQPDSFVLDYYRVDNYGQLYINGTIVYANSIYGGADLRNGSVVTEYIEVEYEGTKVPVGQVVFKNASGTTLGGFYDDGCNAGCKGVAPGINVTSLLKEGNNKLTLVCVNATQIGPCSFSIKGQTKKLAVIGATMDNQCTTLEERAKP